MAKPSALAVFSIHGSRTPLWTFRPPFPPPTFGRLFSSVVRPLSRVLSGLIKVCLGCGTRQPPSTINRDIRFTHAFLRDLAPDVNDARDRMITAA